MTSGRLKNPLDGFSTYSTHFIMVAARTSEKSRAFADESMQSESLAAIDSVTQLGMAIPFQGSTSDVFLVLDTRRFSQFTIDSLKYDVFINGLTSGQSPSNFSSLVNMTILDSVGISFFNYLQWLMDSQMQCSFDGMIFMLRTIFVGHHQDGTTEIIQTVTIPMMLTKMGVNLDYAKGVYECEFMPIFNFSPTENARWTSIGEATTYFTGNGANTLGDLILSFEKKLNDASSKFFDDTSALLKQAGKQPLPATGQFGRKVQYLITLPKGWGAFHINGPSIHAAVEVDFKAKRAALAPAAAPAGSTDKSPTPATSSNVSVEPSQTITDVLDLIFKQVPDIAKLANEAKLTPPSFITFHKHLVTISSDDLTFLVHVDVLAFEVPNVHPKPEAVQQAVDAQAAKFYKPGTNQPINFFELDYIFSGKNLDILNFDMKLQDLQFLLNSNVHVGEGQLYGQADKGQGDDVNKKNIDAKSVEIFNSRAYDPIMIPMMTSAQRKNFSDYAASRSKETSAVHNRDYQDYAKNLSSFYAQSPIMANMKMRGNPDIMAKFTLQQPVAHVSSAGVDVGSPIDRDKYRADLEARILKLDNGAITSGRNGTFSTQSQVGDASYVTSPVFVHLNIYGPNVDFTTNGARSLDGLQGQDLIDGQNFASRILVDAYYTVMKVTNTIDRGVFTQDLELWSHNVYGTNKLTKEQLATKVPQAPATTTTKH